MVFHRSWSPFWAKTPKNYRKLNFTVISPKVPEFSIFSGFIDFQWNLVIFRLSAPPGAETPIFPKEYKGFVKVSFSLEASGFMDFVDFP